MHFNHTPTWMGPIKRFALVIALLSITLPGFAQPWAYDFGTGSSVQANNTSSTTFLTGTPVNGGTYRVRTASATGGGTINRVDFGTTLGTGTELQIVGSTSTSTNKFGVYDWVPASTVAYLKYKVRTTSATNGNLNVSLGVNTLVTDNNGYTSQYNNSIASLTIAYTAGAIGSIVRRNGGANTVITGSGFLKDADQSVEIYANNGAGSTTYYRSGVANPLSTQQWDLWVDGVKISPSGGWAKAGTLASGNITGFGFFSESSTSNSALFILDDIEYSNALPPQPVLDLPNPTSLSGFTTTQFTASATQTFTTAGSNLQGNLVVSAPAEFEVREQGVGSFGTGVSFSPVNGLVSKTIEVRLTGANLGSFGPSDVVISTTGSAANRTVSVTGSVTSAGTPDCLGVINGPAQPNTPCTHPDPCVVGELWDAGCNCVGSVLDSDFDGTCDANDGCPLDPLKIATGACGCGNPEVGSICNDGNDCTTGDQITVCGTCAGSPLLDSDDDGTCDLVDECDSDPLKVLAGACGCGTPEVGASCTDGSDNTVNDQYTACGVCAGVTPFVYWNFQTPAPTTELLPFANVSVLSRGNNNGTTNLLFEPVSVSNHVGASGGNNAAAAARPSALSTAVGGSAYFEFTITPEVDYAVTISRLSFGTRSTGTGPLAYTLRSSADSYTSDLVTGTIAANSAWSLKTHPGLTIATLSGQPLTFRLYGHGGSSSSANSSNWRIDDLNLEGTSAFTPVLPVVGFVLPTNTSNENGGPLNIGITMDIAPASDAVVNVNDLGTGTGVNGTDYAYTDGTVTFLPADIYPSTKFVTVTPTDNGTYGADYSVHLQLSVDEDLAATSITDHILTVLNDDPPTLVINEVDADQPGADTGEFIEIKNNGPVAINLSGIRLQLWNGSNNALYTTNSTHIFGNVSLVAGDYYVVCYGTNASAYCDVTIPAGTIQNGDPDGIRLTTSSGLTIVDQMAYGGITMITTEGTSAVVEPGTIGLGLSRITDGADSNNNSADFLVSCITPGAANTAQDSDNDGTLDCLDLCPGGPEPGSACDDEDDATGNDLVQANCECAGELLDCEGTPGGPNVPGVSCVNEFHPFGDNNPNTNDDVYQADCTCAGQIPDCLGIPGGTAVVGTACNDFDAHTNDETYQAEPYCACVGTPCSQNVELIFRSDANSEQIGWEILYQNDNTVVCSGGTLTTPYPNGISYIPENCCLPIGCFRLRVMDSGGDGFVSGGVTGGYQLRELNGLQRRIIDNFDNFTNLANGTPGVSPDVSAMSTLHDLGAFCVPMGNGKPVFQHCDKLDWANDGLVALVATEDPLVSASWSASAPPADKGYEFWWFDPNGTYSFRRFRSHSSSDGYSPANATRACKVKINGWSNTPTSPHLAVGKLYNVRIRSRYGASNFSAFGPACLFKINPSAAACPLVKLQDNPANLTDYSCGVTRRFGGGNSAGINMNSALPGSAANWGNKIVATPPQPIPAVPSANVRYQFRFMANGEVGNPLFTYISAPQTSPTIYLNWATGVKLKCGVDYLVDVRVSLDNGATWCVGGATNNPANAQAPRTYWGPLCEVKIRLNNNADCPAVPLTGGSSNLTLANNSGNLTMYPNPNRGDQLFISLSEVGVEVNTVSVDIFDMTGKKVTARTIAVQDGYLKTVLDLSGTGGVLVQGLYMVQVTAGPAIYTERLVIE